MNLKLPPALLSATRLVRRGKLLEATDAIQRALGLRDSSTATGDRAPIDGTWRVHREEQPPASAPGQFVTRSYSNAAGAREYKTYIPASYNGQALPLLVMLHGCKQGPDDFAAGTRMNALADEHGFVVVYPKQAGKANVSKCWNWFQPNHQQRDGGEPSLIAGITREVVTAYGLDRRRVYVAGLSAGGAMAAVMGTTYPDIYAAVGIHSGLAYAAAGDVPSAFAAMRGDKSAQASQRSSRAVPSSRSMPTIVFHGDSDQTVHPSNGDELIARAQPVHGTSGDSEPPLHERTTEEGEAGGRAYTRNTYRDREGTPLMEQWIVHGAAHAWCGGSAKGSYCDPAGPDASREMLRFFLLHELPKECLCLA